MELNLKENIDKAKGKHCKVPFPASHWNRSVMISAPGARVYIVLQVLQSCKITSPRPFSIFMAPQKPRSSLKNSSSQEILS